MKNADNDGQNASRRSVLQLAALTGGSGMFLPGLATGKSQNGTVGSTSAQESDLHLGTFESDKDGWITDGGNKLDRISENEFPVGVAEGTRALSVEVEGDLFPAIRKSSDLENVPFSTHPHLQAHVVAIVEDTDSDLLFQFRLHHKPTKGDSGGKSSKKDGGKKEQKGGGPARGKQKHVIESEFTRVQQISPEEIHWDLSDLSDHILDSVERVELAWHLEDHEPDGGPRGRTKGDFEYRGIVLVDDIRLHESDPETDILKQSEKKRQLHREHGMIVDREFETRTQDLERGILIFSDGIEIPYEFEILDDGRSRYTLDGETFEFGGGNDE